MRPLVPLSELNAIVERRKRYSDRGRQEDGLMDPVPAGSPLQTAQLIGSLVIRFVMYAESGLHWEEFPDRALLQAILDNCKDPELAKEHLTAMLYHHSKILDNCGRPNNLRKLVQEAFPEQTKKDMESPKWEIV